MEAPEASIIVAPARHGTRLERCLTTIAETTGDVEAEVVVVLDGPDPDLGEVARSHPRADVVIESTASQGFGAAGNLGRRHASAGRLVYLHDDTVVHPGTIRRLLDVLDARPEVGACGPLTRGGDGRVVAAGPVLFADGHSAAPAAGEARSTDYCASSALALRAEAFDAAGGFEEAYVRTGYADADLGLALWRTGWTVWFEPSASVVHDAGAGATESVGFRAFCHRRNRAIFTAKWGDDLADREPLDRGDLDGSIARAVARAATRAPRRAELPPRPAVAPADVPTLLRAYVDELESTPAAGPLAEELAQAHAELAAGEEHRAALTAELERTQAALAAAERLRAEREEQLAELDEHVRASAVANERLTEEVERLRGRERELEAILGGGWWRLRGRLEPALRLVQRRRPG